ncbi:amidohydrolase [Aliiglaciecola sp. 3_MG-2023]|uniref:amidohydrolase n=1 Tax=Aliiglaciecola sp. 3_MG-2023 TaxID=3062644 RepID=UPI0026E20FF7|nr:amidohydrolase [Aliiglaciecola sp. 3_MG-2023]MDO6692491.1 amidohydrolase [Aliiglaciecola sp. 3_MG-2023]
MKIKFKQTLAASFLCTLTSFSNFAQVQNQNESRSYSQSHQLVMKQIAKTMWETPELGFLEHNSSALMQKVLRERGFTVNVGVAGMPTAFVAEYGETGPVIGLLAEMDALPGMGVQNTPDKQPISSNGNVHAGHACGHNLFAGGVVGSALALADYLDEHPNQGKLKVFGTPAEEGGSGKVYMVREGLFDDVDVALHWHPSDSTSAAPYTSLANKSGKFRFYGVAAHAAAAPDKGRSALDAVEAMNMMVNMMREHVPDGTRIHYVITHGGTAPNIVPEFAEVYYYVRSVKPALVLSLWDRLINAADGAALGTQTRVEVEVTGGVWSVLPNVVLSKLANQAILHAQPIMLSEEEQNFAKNISKTLNHSFDLKEHSDSLPFSENIATWSASTDVGDVSWQVPTVGISSATWVRGTPPHTWQASSMSGTGIGYKGMYLASDVLTQTAISLYSEPENIEAAKKEYLERKDALKYKSMIGDRAPALDYRKK